jgi:photosystem II stability/assembly factor-like uncharacterized protein
MKTVPFRLASSFALVCVPVLLSLMLGNTFGQSQIAADTRPASTAQLQESMLQGLRYRMIGPHRGGRSTAVAGVPGDHRTFYMGATGGGVWKTTDAGEVWENVSDGYFKTGSVGAIAVAASDPKVIYVGTGSASIRNNIEIGHGTYKSTDGGATWSSIGLEDAGQIAKIRIDPRDPNRVYVAAVGHAFGPNSQRGVFRSRDVGKSWEKDVCRDVDWSAPSVGHGGRIDRWWSLQDHGWRRPLDQADAGASPGNGGQNRRGGFAGNA